MSANPNDDDRQPTRDEIERWDGPLLLEFGTGWCGHCQALAPKLSGLLDDHPEIKHIKVEDGPGKPLGRSFGVKLWPTLVFMKGGAILKQVARPGVAEIEDGLAVFDSAETA